MAKLDELLMQAQQTNSSLERARNALTAELKMRPGPSWKTTTMRAVAACWALMIATAVALMAAGAAATLARPLPPATDAYSLLIGYWLVAWGEAVLTGMLTAIFVAYKPEWLFTWSDRRYLPRPPA